MRPIQDNNALKVYVSMASYHVPTEEVAQHALDRVNRVIEQAQGNVAQLWHGLRLSSFSPAFVAELEMQGFNPTEPLELTSASYFFVRQVVGTVGRRRSSQIT